VPIDYFARAEVSQALVKLLRLPPGQRLDERLGCDIRGVGPSFKKPAADLAYADPTIRVDPGDIYRDIWGVGFKPNQTATGFYMDLSDYPLRGIQTMDEIESHPWPTADMWDYSTIADQARSVSDYWVWAHSRGIFEISWFIRGFDEFLEDMAVRPERANAVMDRVQAYLMDRTERILQAGDGLIDMMEYNDDVGGQYGLLMSPAMWRQFIKPRMARFIAMCREYGVRIRFHCCGGCRPIINDLIEIGVDVLNPVQTVADGMEPEGLKRDFGDRITFNGGIDTQQLLPYATEDEVRAETRRLIDILGRDGGYILAPAHNFQADVPLRNIVAVYETALGEKLV